MSAERVVWKYELDADLNSVIVTGAIVKPLHVAAQRGRMCLWILVDPTANEMWRLPVRVMGTGCPLPAAELASFTYLGSLLIADGAFVFHAFVGEAEKIR